MGILAGVPHCELPRTDIRYGFRDWPVWEREATWGNLAAAIHRHSLRRLNAINDYLKIKKK